jgi:hypothetical protein
MDMEKARIKEEVGGRVAAKEIKETCRMSRSIPTEMLNRAVIER